MSVDRKNVEEWIETIYSPDLKRVSIKEFNDMIVDRIRLFEQQHIPLSEVMIDLYGDIDSDVGQITITRVRKETDTEIEHRLNTEKKCAEEEDDEERLVYERLKKKFGKNRVNDA